MTLNGTLKRLDLGTGVWVLETGDGERVALVGDVPAALDGRRVEVRGRSVEAMGFGMVGARAFEVERVTER